MIFPFRSSEVCCGTLVLLCGVRRLLVVCEARNPPLAIELWFLLVRIGFATASLSFNEPILRFVVIWPLSFLVWRFLPAVYCGELNFLTPPSFIELFNPVFTAVVVFLVELMFVAPPFVIVFKPSVRVS